MKRSQRVPSPELSSDFFQLSAAELKKEQAAKSLDAERVINLFSLFYLLLFLASHKFSAEKFFSFFFFAHYFLVVGLKKIYLSI